MAGHYICRCEWQGIRCIVGNGRSIICEYRRNADYVCIGMAR